MKYVKKYDQLNEGVFVKEIKKMTPEQAEFLGSVVLSISDSEDAVRFAQIIAKNFPEAKKDVLDDERMTRFIDKHERFLDSPEAEKLTLRAKAKS